MKFLLVTVVLIVAVLGGVIQVKVKLRQKAELSLGKPVKAWERERNGVKEYIKFCELGDKDLQCSTFITADGKAGKPETKAKVLKDGKLVIEEAQKHDEGSYGSPDKKRRPHVARTSIELHVE